VPLGRVADSDNVEVTHAEALELPQLRLAWPRPPESPDAPARGCGRSVAHAHAARAN
jgi:hypothetical protein